MTMKRDVFFDRITCIVSDFRKASEAEKPDIIKKILRLERFRSGLMEFCKMLLAKNPK